MLAASDKLSKRVRWHSRAGIELNHPPSLRPHSFFVVWFALIFTFFVLAFSFFFVLLFSFYLLVGKG